MHRPFICCPLNHLIRGYLSQWAFVRETRLVPWWYMTPLLSQWPELPPKGWNKRGSGSPKVPLTHRRSFLSPSPWRRGDWEKNVGTGNGGGGRLIGVWENGAPNTTDFLHCTRLTDDTSLETKPPSMAGAQIKRSTPTRPASKDAQHTLLCKRCAGQELRPELIGLFLPAPTITA